jgi:hypothetical protein
MEPEGKTAEWEGIEAVTRTRLRFETLEGRKLQPCRQKREQVSRNKGSEGSFREHPRTDSALEKSPLILFHLFTLDYSALGK